MSHDEIMAAQARLEQVLTDVLGKTLPGVTSFGARWDKSTRGVALGVAIDEGRDPATYRSKLPARIGDLPVQVFVRPLAAA